MEQGESDILPPVRLPRGDGAIGPAVGQGTVTPALFAGSPQSVRRFWEFFLARIPNDHTRRAYFAAVNRFAAWCAQHRFDMPCLQPILIAAYIEEIEKTLAAPSVKQHLAAIRMLFDYGYFCPTPKKVKSAVAS